MSFSYLPISQEPEKASSFIAGMRIDERVHRTLRHLNVVPWNENSSADDVLLVRLDRMFDFGLLKSLIMHSASNFTLIHKNQEIGVARVSSNAFKSQLIATSRENSKWPEWTRDLQTVEISTMDYYDKEMRKLVTPKSYDPSEEDISTIEQHWLNYADKGTNDWAAKNIHRPPQNLITKLLWRVPWISPNMITIFNMVISIAATFCFATGNFFIGTVLTNTNGILDGVDGKLARTTLRFSKLGGYLDHIADQIADGLWYFAIGWGLLEMNLPISSLWLSFVFMVFYFMDRIATGTFAQTHDVQLHDFRKFDRWIRTYGARRSNNMVILFIGAFIGAFFEAFLFLLVYTVVTALIKAWRAIWITWQRKETDLVFPNSHSS